MCASAAEGTLLGALLAVHEVLDSEEIEHALCGGIAANLYREEIRATTDVDLYIVCSGPRLVDLTRAFEQRGWQAHPAWRQAELVRLERTGSPRVDLLIAATGYERQAVERAVDATFDGEIIRVLRREDLIVFKLVAGRARDYEAVAAILNNATVPGLDREFIQRSLSDLGMDDRWVRALDEAEREKEDLG